MKKYIMHTFNDKDIPPIFINPDTGEVLDGTDIVVYAQTNSRRVASRDYFDLTNTSKKMSSARGYGEFVQLIYSPESPLFPNVKPSDITRLLFLSTYMDYDNFMVLGNKPIDNVDFSLLLNVSIEEGRAFFTRMIECNIFRESSDGVQISKDYFCKGRLNNRKQSSMRIYTNGVRSLYNGVNSRAHKSLSYLFRLIPYVNKQYNIVCRHPLEGDVRVMRSMSAGDCCDLFHYGRSHASKMRNYLLSPRFTYGDHPMAAASQVTLNGIKGSAIIVNPRIYYGGTKWNEVESLGGFT